MTEAELRALWIAARQTPRTRREERIEHHPLGRGYVAALTELGLLAYTQTSRGECLEMTALAVEVIGAHWRREKFTVPKGSQHGQADHEHHRVEDRQGW